LRKSHDLWGIVASNRSNFTFPVTVFFNIILRYSAMNVGFITSGFKTLDILKYKNCYIPVHDVLQTDTCGRFGRSYCRQLQGIFKSILTVESVHVTPIIRRTMLNGHASGWFFIIRTQRQGAPGCWNNKLHDNYCERVGIGSCALRDRLPRRALVSPWYVTRVWRFRDEVRHQGWPVSRATSQAVGHRLHNAEDRHRFHASPCELCSVPCGTGTDFFSRYFRFTLWRAFQQHSQFMRVCRLPRDVVKIFAHMKCYSLSQKGKVLQFKYLLKNE